MNALTLVDSFIPAGHGGGGDNTCFAFQRGKCDNGDACRFEHSKYGPGKGKGKGKGGDSGGSICFAYQRGACENGDACRFEHEIQNRRGKGKGKGGDGGKGFGFRPGPQYDAYVTSLRDLPPPPEGLTEAEVGISGYVHAAPGFSGLFRERYSDFMVHEVALDGQVAKVATLEVDPLLGFSASAVAGVKRARVDEAGEASVLGAQSTERNDIGGKSGAVSEGTAGEGAAEEGTATKKARAEDGSEPIADEEAADASTMETTNGDGQAATPDAATAAAASVDSAAAAEAARMKAIVAQAWESAAAALEEAYAAIGQGSAARVAIESLRDAEDTRLRVLLPPTLDKAVRKAAHDALHTHLPDAVDADTIDEPEAAAVRAQEVAAEKEKLEAEAAAANEKDTKDAALAPSAPPAAAVSIMNPMDRFKRDTYGIKPPPPKSASTGSAAAAGTGAAEAPSLGAIAAKFPKLPMCLRIWRRPPRGQKRGKLVGTSEGEVGRDSRSNEWQRRARTAWPSDRPEYLRFALYKENVDTMQAMDRVATALRVSGLKSFQINNPSLY